MSHSPARSSIDVGSVIAGTYTIEALIGRGGMGAVFLASHARLPGKQVAIKVLHAELGGDEIEARFKREAQIASMLSHPNIVHIEDYNVTAEGMPYLVLEYLQGESLGQRLRRGPMTVDEITSVIRQVGSALAAAHAKGIVHRDLKPQNIFLVPSDLDGHTREVAKVLDFGISKMRDSQTVKTQESALLGTPQYMAPEQATGQHDKVDERTDIFALGAIVYEMLSGAPAFSGQTIPEVVFKVVYEQPADLATRVPSAPPAIVAAVNRAMSKAQNERFPNVSAFVEALTGAPVSVMRTAARPTAPPAGFDGTGPTSASGNTPHTPMTPQQALAATMASGDHAVAMQATLPSQPGAQATSQPAPPTTPTPASTGAARPAVSVAPAKRAPVGLLLGGVFVAAAAIGGIVVATRGHSGRPRSERVAKNASGAPATIAVASPDAASAIEQVATGGHTDDAGTIDSGDARPHDAGVARPADAGVATVKTPKKPPSPDVDDNGGAAADSLAGTLLAEARDHIAKQQWGAARATLDKALGDKDAKPGQLDQVRMLRGVVACSDNDTEKAKNALDGLVGRPKMRARVLEVCHKNGWFEDIKR